MRMVSNIWINETMNYFTRFIGVVSIDRLEPPHVFPSYTMVNFSKTGEAGSHYVSIIFNSPELCIYFDPLNLLFLPDAIFQYMRTHSKMVYRVNNKIQSDLSIFCGFYCLIPIFLHMNNVPILKGLSFFSKNLIKNDEICIILLKKLIQMYFD